MSGGSNRDSLRALQQVSALSLQLDLRSPDYPQRSNVQTTELETLVTTELSVTCQFALSDSITELFSGVFCTKNSDLWQVQFCCISSCAQEMVPSDDRESLGFFTRYTIVPVAAAYACVRVVHLGHLVAGL